MENAQDAINCGSEIMRGGGHFHHRNDRNVHRLVQGRSVTKLLIPSSPDRIKMGMEMRYILFESSKENNADGDGDGNGIS